MKHLLKSIAVLGALVLAASCTTKEYYLESCQSYDLNVRNGMWVANTDELGGTYYSCQFDVPDLTSDIYNFGLVTCYVDYDGAQQQLPCVRHCHQLEEDEYGEYDYQWTETTDFEFSVGSVTVYFTASDFYGELPASMLFRLVLTR